MKTGTVLAGLFIFAVLMLVFGVYITQNNSVKAEGDIFNGVIINLNLSPQVLDGGGVYDQSCAPVENGLTQCDAGIQTSAGLINMNYKHNMHMQRCIDKGQKLKVEVFEGGKVKVTRL